MSRKEAPGIKSIHGRKVRGKTVSFTMTEDGHKALQKLLRGSELSRADFLESLVREAAAK